MRVHWSLVVLAVFGLTVFIAALVVALKVLRRLAEYDLHHSRDGITYRITDV